MLARRGYRFRTQTDTEIAALLLDDLYAQDGALPPRERAVHAIGELALRLRGAYALGILFADQPGAVYAIRQDSPLILGQCTGAARGHMLASDIPAMLAYTREVIDMDNGEIARMTADAMEFFACDGQPIQKNAVHIGWDAQAAEKGGYAHFMLKEMHEQPAAVRDTLSPRIAKTQAGLETDLRETGMTREDWQRVARVCMIGCGSAYHAGLVGRCAVQALAGIPCECEVASELRAGDAPAQEDMLCVVISQSGETADSLAALRCCRAQGMKTLAVVNTVGSSIAREADAVLYTHAGMEIAVATTKAYAAQLAAMDLLAIHLADARGRLEHQAREALLKELTTLDEKIAQTLEMRTHIQRIASEYAARRDAFFIGRGLDAALSMEGSLKLKEISYINAQAYPAGELKHGAISLIEEGTLVVCTATQPEQFDKMRSAATQVKSRGARVLAITTREGGEKLADAADEVVFVPTTHPLLAASLAVVPMQMLAYEIACERRLDVDKPRNLAKSVTVE